MSLAARTSAINPSSVETVGTTSTLLAAANRDRRELFVSNTHASQTLSLSLGGTAVAGEGIVLAAGAALVLSSYAGAVYAIGSGAGTTVAVAEV